MIEQIEKLKINYANHRKKLRDEIIVDHIFNICEKIYPKVVLWLDYSGKKYGLNVDYQELIDELHCFYQI